jgi:hypothetical protein
VEKSKSFSPHFQHVFPQSTEKNPSIYSIFWILSTNMGLGFPQVVENPVWNFSVFPPKIGRKIGK